MIKSAVSSAVVAASFMICGAAHAQAWTFTYTGFLDSNTGLFDQNYAIAGAFSGNDANSDGILDLSELSSLFVNGTNYIACASDSNAYYHCGVDSFSYAQDGTLHFMAGIYSSDPEGMVGGGHYFEAGVGEYEYHYNPYNYSASSYTWTGETTGTVASAAQVRSLIVLSAVPEPGTWAMLAAGLLLIGGNALRRRSSPLGQQAA